MLICYPSYYKKFKCIADKCIGSCCSAGWEIDIDNDTSNFYSTLPGTFGNKLRDNISFGTPSHFKLKPDGRCPFLNNQNLCDIYTELGEQNLCQICKDHPRFYECFNDIIECGLGLYCEEAARIILSESEKFSTYKEETNDNITCHYNERLYLYLRTARSKIFEYLSSSSATIFSKIQDILWYADTLQQNIDFDMLDEETLIPVDSTKQTDIKLILNFLQTLIENDSNWFRYLQESYTTAKSNIHKLEEFASSNPEIDKYIENISTYYIYRYFLNAVYDEDVLSKVKLMTICIATLYLLFFSKWLEKSSLTLTDCIFITKKLSEEIECNDDNLSKIYNSTYELDELSTENLIGLF